MFFSFCTGKFNILTGRLKRIQVFTIFERLWMPTLYTIHLYTCIKPCQPTYICKKMFHFWTFISPFKRVQTCLFKLVVHTCYTPWVFLPHRYRPGRRHHQRHERSAHHQRTHGRGHRLWLGQEDREVAQRQMLKVQLFGKGINFQEFWWTFWMIFWGYCIYMYLFFFLNKCWFGAEWLWTFIS